jgi:hypothetical protein
MECWNAILHVPTKAQAGTFCAMIARAVFMIEKPEWDHVKAKLEAKMHPTKPTKQQIIKGCSTIIPSPRHLGERVVWWAVINYFYYCDMQTQLEVSSSIDPSVLSGEPNSSKLYMKLQTPEIQRIIQNQLSHVDKGCLSDLPSLVVSLQRMNPCSGIVYTGCSTGSCEVDNRMLNHLLDSSHVAPALAERKIWMHHDHQNERKRVTRLGEREELTLRTEKVALVNSFASEAGFKDKELPFPHLATPRVQHTHEFMDLSYDLPDSFKEDVNPGEEDVLADFLYGVDWSKDVPVDVDQYSEPVNNDVDTDTKDNDADFAFDDGPEVDALQDTLTLDMVSLNRVEPLSWRETTFEAYKRLVQAPWVPLTKPDATEKTALDEEEAKLFNDLLEKHRYKVTTEDYKKFELEWDREVANWYKKKVLQGDDSVILIHRKHYCDLLDYHQQLKDQDALSETAGNQDLVKDVLDTLRDTSQKQPHMQEVHVCGPVGYYQVNGTYTPFGNPLTLNPSVAATAFHPLQTQQVPWKVHQRVQTPAVMDGFQKKRYCSTCGYPAGEHFRGNYGANCTDNCGYEECSKCKMRLEFHSKHDEKDKLLCGPLCPHSAHPKSICYDWCNPSKRRRTTTRYVNLYSVSEITIVCFSITYSVILFSMYWMLLTVHVKKEL